MHEEDVKEWLRFANMDLNTAKHLFETMYPKPYEIICYHCQQAAEKFIKAIFVLTQKEIVKTHDLVVLAKSLDGIYVPPCRYFTLMCNSYTLWCKNTLSI